MKRTLQAMIAQVQRSCGATNVPLGDIQKALDTANKDVHSSYDWPWSYTETNILVPASYSTGTISISNGTTAVVGLGTVWSTGWTGRRMRFGGTNVDYLVSSFGSATTATLAQAVNLEASVSAGSYTVYQDTFAMPSDFEPGQDIFLSQPTLRLRIKHIPRYQFEKQALVLRPMSTNMTMYYADAGWDSTLNTYQIRFMPPISQVGEYRLVYRKRPADLTSLTQVSPIPEGYDEVLELMAEARLKQTYNLPGAEGAQMKALGKLKLLRKQIATATIDNQPSTTGALSDSSFSQWGLSVTPWVP